MINSTLDKEGEAIRVKGIRLRARRGGLGDHELVMDPKYCGKWLAEENK